MYISTHKRFETAQNYVGTIQSCQSARIEKTSARIPCGDAVSVLKIESLEALEFLFLGVKAFLWNAPALWSVTLTYCLEVKSGKQIRVGRVWWLVAESPNGGFIRA